MKLTLANIVHRYLLLQMKSLKSILSTTQNYIDELEKAGIKSIEDFLNYYPRTYELQNKGNNFNELRSDQINNIKAKVCTKSNSTTKNGRTLYKCVIEDSPGDLAEAVWFTKPYFWEMLFEGKSYTFVGKAQLAYGKFQLPSPKVEFQSKAQNGDILPVYSQIGEKLTPQWFKEKMNCAISEISIIEENLPQPVIESENLIPRRQAITQIHFPNSQVELEKAKERLAFEELFLLQHNALTRKEEIKTNGESQNLRLKMHVDLIKDLIASLPFTLTDAQRIAIYQILKDMEAPYPMNRLLEGDVGSGKTLVALASSLNVLHNGKQVAFMAPTEILARQHFNVISNLIKSLPGDKYEDKFRPGLLIGAMTPKQKKITVESLQGGQINFLIGTHALISDYVNFNNLGLCIIDEQHRFGVLQRQALESQGLPHVLYMTATPIPRTLALIAYGDQDISILREMPRGRKVIHTKVVNSFEKNKIYGLIDSEILKGRQAYVVCPLISESENLEDVKAAESQYEYLRTEIFPNRRLALLHGKVKPKVKEQTMQDFKANKYDILVSTTVVEVGVDVPNCTIMIIEGAERFGLSQLHQLRGRVGRNEHQSYCFLFTSDNKNEITRLKAMENNNDGFKLAEIDMEIRGPGEVFGFRQSGLPDLVMASLSNHQMVIRARQSAEKYLGLTKKI